MMRRSKALDRQLAAADPVGARSLPAPEGSSRQERLEVVLQTTPEKSLVTGGSSRRRRARRAGALILVGLLVVAGVAAAAIRWSADDIPAHGSGSYVFSAAVVDHLPQGYNRVRPARIDELPVRPAMLFGRGVSYPEAVARYLAAREAGRTLPDGVELVDPLPNGISVRVRDDGRVMLDPAAPVGWDITSRLVATLFGGPRDGLRSLTLARCQVALASDDPAAPANCRVGPDAPLVRATGSRWTPAGPIGVVLPTRIVGSTDLSVLTRARTSADDLPPALERSLRQTYEPSDVQRFTLDFGDSRLAGVFGARRIYVIPATDGDTVCLQVQAGGNGAGTCNPRSVLVTFGAIPLIGANTYSGLVGDGYDRVTVPGLGSFPIRDNVFSVPLPDRPVKAITLSGPLGRQRISTFGHG